MNMIRSNLTMGDATPKNAYVVFKFEFKIQFFKPGIPDPVPNRFMFPEHHPHLSVESTFYYTSNMDHRDSKYYTNLSGENNR